MGGKGGGVALKKTKWTLSKGGVGWMRSHNGGLPFKTTETLVPGGWKGVLKKKEGQEGNGQGERLDCGPGPVRVQLTS